MGGDIRIRERLPHDVAWIAGIACLLYAVLWVLTLGVGSDAHAYWRVWRGPMYTVSPGETDAYLYSPAFAQAIWPLARLPWPVFVTIFDGGLAAILAWLLKPMGWKWAIPLWLVGLPEVLSGNIFILMAAVVVIGFSTPESWAFVALTKISPCVGPIWFIVRREWKQLFRCMLAVAIVVAVSGALAGDLWREWFRFLAENLHQSAQPIGSPFMPSPLIRVPIGLVVVIWAARGDRRWAIPVAVLLCTPVLWLGSITLLAAIPRMLPSRQSHDA